MKQTKESNKQLEQRIAQLEVQLHEQKYTHIKISWKQIGMFLLCLGVLALCYANLLLIISAWQTLGINELLPETTKPEHLIICWPLIGQSVLIALAIIQIKATFKGGYQEVKDRKEDKEDSPIQKEM